MHRAAGRRIGLFKAAHRIGTGPQRKDQTPVAVDRANKVARHHQRVRVNRDPERVNRRDRGARQHVADWQHTPEVVLAGKEDGSAAGLITTGNKGIHGARHIGEVAGGVDRTCVG